MNLSLVCIESCPTFKEEFQNFAGSVLLPLRRKCKNNWKKEKDMWNRIFTHSGWTSVKDETLEGEKRCRAEIGTLYTGAPFIILILCSFMFCFVFCFRLVMWEWKVRRNNFESQEKTDKTLTYIIDYIKKKLDMTSASAITRKSESVGHERVVHSISCVSMNKFTNKREIL
jgi:hypothetical protein